MGQDIGTVIYDVEQQYIKWVDQEYLHFLIIGTELY